VKGHRNTAIYGLVTDTANWHKIKFAVKNSTGITDNTEQDITNYLTANNLTLTEIVPNNFAKISEVPTKTSDIENDSGFATVSQIPTDNADLKNGAGYLTTETDPTVPAWAKMYYGINRPLNTDDALNGTNTVGFYYVAATNLTTASLPAQIANSYSGSLKDCELVNLPYAAGAYGIQLLFHHYSNMVFTRVQDNTTWGAWQMLATAMGINAKDLIVNAPATTPTGAELTAYQNLGEKLVVANPNLTASTMDAILCSPRDTNGIGWASGAEALAFMNGLPKSGGTMTGALNVPVINLI
jgi:hypothetical protein